MAERIKDKKMDIEDCVFLSKHILCVGDPKQAIYKFRGGDIETYLNAKVSCRRPPN